MIETIDEPDFYSEVWAGIAEAEKKYAQELSEKKEKFKEQLRSLLNVDLVWNFLNDNDNWEPEGSIDIKIIEGKENGRHIAIDLSEPTRKFERQDEHPEEAGVDHVYCWQTNGYLGDDYSGWMLFPLSNGRYFRVSYSC